MVNKKLAIAGMTLILLSGCSATTQRAIKDTQSEYNGGLHRTVDVYQNGKSIKHYEGKFDVVKTAGKVKFIDQNNKVHIIYFSGDTTVVTDEE